MKLSPQWIREFVTLTVNDRQLAEALTAAGIAVENIADEGANTIFEMEIGTNRPDAMNHYGVAREAAAIYDVPLKALEASAAKAAHSFESPTAALKRSATQNQPAAKAASAKASDGTTEVVPFPIEIEDIQGCARYTARVIRGVTIKPSPEAVAQRLLLVDQRPINNAADASNYTLWEMGHPTHAFDLDLLEGGKLVVRKARAGETLKTLDGVDRKLFPEDLIIADAKKPVALAGVMGGFDTMITGRTKNVLIESAWFDPAVVRKTAKRHGLHTDASHRFERGADFGATSLACALVAQRILESGGGQLHGGEIDVVARALDQAPIALHIPEVHRFLGKALDTHSIYRILVKLGFDLLPERGGGGDPDFTVRIPSWRLDVEREIDLVEEIARLYGYDKFPNTLPAFAGAVIELPEARKDARLRTALLALGYNEGLSLSFISHEDAETFSSIPVIELENPLSEEAAIMRTSMVPGMLNMLAYNLNRGTTDVRLFEAGSVYERAGAKALEPKRICLGSTGNALAAGVHQPARPLTFFDLKGDLETLLESFQHGALYYDAHVADYYHPGRSARAVMDGATVAQFGQLHPDIAESRKLRQEVFLAELYLDRLYKHDLRHVRYQPLPKYPAVERDFSFVFADEVAFEKIQQAVTALGLQELRRFVPAEIFRGGSIAAGKYSLLLRATFQSADRTLREEEVAQWSGQIVQALQALGGTLRAQ